MILTNNMIKDEMNPWRVDVTFPPPWAPKKSHPWRLDATFPTPGAPKKILKNPMGVRCIIPNPVGTKQ